MFYDLPLMTSRYKWWVALVTLILAAIVFAPAVFLLVGGASSGLTGNPQVNFSGAPSVWLYLLAALFFFFLLRLLYEWVPIHPNDRWKYTVISTVLALLVFAPFLTSAIVSAVGGRPGDYNGIIFLVELIIFFLLVRLSFR